MKNKRLILRVTVLAVIALALGSAFYSAYTNDESQLEVGKPAPDFELVNLQGEKVRLSDLKGKGVFINFWGSWCEPCKEEMPHIESQYKLMKDQGIEILGINIAESNLAVSAFVDRYELSFPILLDRDRALTNRYRIGAIPSSLFVNKDGILVARHEGAMNENQISQYLQMIKP